MNEYLLSVLLGIVEGLTEFLPVSSTAHLRITEALCRIDLDSGYWKMYSVVIQLGAILCLPIYFRERLWKFVRTFPEGERGDRTIFNHPLSLTMVAFVVTAGPAFMLKKVIGENLANLYVMGSALLIGGVVMWVVDAIYPKLYSRKGGKGFDLDGNATPARGTPVSGVAAALNPAALVLDYPDQKREPVFHRTEHMEDMNIFQAIWIGAWQIMSAVFPGTSRSMSTIASGQLAGMTRASALEFSFFLSMPTMVVATGFEFLSAVGLKKSKHAGAIVQPIQMDTHRWIVLAIGFVISFFVAWAVVAWFMSWVRRRGFAPFAAYRIVVGILVLMWAVKLQKPATDAAAAQRPLPTAAAITEANRVDVTAPVLVSTGSTGGGHLTAHPATKYLRSSTRSRS